MLISKEFVLNKELYNQVWPNRQSFDLPERVLQFGTGVLLRGLPDYYINSANKQGVFNGRIAVVKSTGTSTANGFDQQDAVYTICTRGIEHNQKIIAYTVSNAISRVLTANRDWAAILEIAKNPDLSVILSNTTEAGIVSSDDRIFEGPPSSFPGKLLAFLYKRYQFFEGDLTTGCVILPTELISDNAQTLKNIVLDLAKKNNLEPAFIIWLTEANDFCNTLVDRIVPGLPAGHEQLEIERELGYNDNLMVVAEPYNLWAIETDSDRVRKTLSFTEANPEIKLVPSLYKYKEIKLRLLNGTHTLCCAIALWSGFETVKDAMENDLFKNFILDLMREEIGPAILDHAIQQQDIDRFSDRVIDRFSNPFLEHQWKSIALNYTSKIQLRVVDLIEKWYNKSTLAPSHIALGIAAYLKFMDTQLEQNSYAQKINGKTFVLQDTMAVHLFAHWKNQKTIVYQSLSDEQLWKKDLTKYPDFTRTVQFYLDKINTLGMLKTLEFLKHQITK